MRVLYFLIGVLFGIYGTARIGTECLVRAEKWYDQDLVARTLTGYYEGWARGRQQSDGWWARYVLDCEEGRSK